MELDFLLIAKAVPIVAALVQAIKLLAVPSKFLPLISVFLGLAICFLLASFTFTPLIWLSGIVAGLSASGLYDQIRKGVEMAKGE